MSKIPDNAYCKNCIYRRKGKVYGVKVLYCMHDKNPLYNQSLNEYWYCPLWESEKKDDK